MTPKETLKDKLEQAEQAWGMEAFNPCDLNATTLLERLWPLIAAHLQQQAEAIERLTAERGKAEARAITSERFRAEDAHSHINELADYAKLRQTLKADAKLGQQVMAMREGIAKACEGNDNPEDKNCPCAYCVCERILAAIDAVSLPKG